MKPISKGIAALLALSSCAEPKSASDEKSEYEEVLSCVASFVVFTAEMRTNNASDGLMMEASERGHHILLYLGKKISKSKSEVQSDLKNMTLEYLKNNSFDENSKMTTACIEKNVLQF